MIGPRMPVHAHADEARLDKGSASGALSTGPRASGRRTSPPLLCRTSAGYCESPESIPPNHPGRYLPITRVDTSQSHRITRRATSVLTMDEQLPRANRIEIPDEHVVGVPADFASVWHTTESFVIDFLSVKAPEQLVEHEGQAVVMQDLVVNARIRMPPTHVIELMKALEQQLSLWETETGQRPPTEPLHPDLDS